MNTPSEFILRSVLLGGGATFVMDVWAAALRRFGIPSLKLEHLGRWIAYMPRGRWFHDGMAKTPAVRGERWIGGIAHYGIGVTFAGLLLGVFGLDWARSPTIGPSLLVGVITVLAPWFILQPAIGAGIASSKTSAPLFNGLKSLVTHMVFGVGLYLTARALAWVVPTF